MKPRLTKLAALAAPALLAALLTACASNAPQPPAAEPPPPAPVAQAEPESPPPAGPYLHELLQEQSAALKAWQRMAASRKGAPRWIRQGSGPTEPAQRVQIKERDYWQGQVCEAHNCPNTFFFLLGEKRAFGLHANFSQPKKARPIYYGAPPAAEKAALKAQFDAALEQALQEENGR